MPKFGTRSASKLATCHHDIRMVLEKVVQRFDCTVLEGRRSKERQDELFAQGLSKVKWPNSKHNCPDGEPSKAVDVVPYPIDWEDTNRMRYFAGVVMGTAWAMGVKLRWGGDWDRDTELKDNRFNDLPHFELDE